MGGRLGKHGTGYNVLGSRTLPREGRMPAVICNNCGTSFEKSPAQLRRSANHYCSRSCAAKINNHLSPKRKRTNQCRVCHVPVSQRQTFCSFCRTLPLKQRRPDAKMCSRCGQTRPMSDFYMKHKATGLRQAFCRACFNSYCIHRWQERKKRAVGHLGGRCRDCGGEFHPNVYDFHHLRDKDFVWDKLRLRSWKQITEELDKCVLLCANCHWMRHVEDAEEEETNTPPVS